ncbi:hypothetical protein EV426DRAFT_708054 [Tirmania nivea]|nr:hypothetical protein EV426DRAFT_708054 [Tirmania nivea]
MTHRERTNVYAEDQPNKLYHLNAHEYDTTTHMHALPTLPLRNRPYEDGEHDSLGLVPQQGYCYTIKQSTILDKFSPSSVIEDGSQFKVPARRVTPAKDLLSNKAPNCDPYSPESLHRIGMKLLVTVPYESVYGPTTNPNAPKYVEVPLETITNDGRKRSMQIDGGVYLPPPSRYGTAPTSSNYNSYKPSPWSPIQPVYFAHPH